MKKKTLYILLAVLFVFNLLLVGLILKGPPQGKRPEDFLIKRLDLSSEQQKELEPIKADFQGKIGQLHKENRALRHSMFDQIRSDDNLILADSITQEIAQKEVQINRLVYSFFKSLRKICNEEQQVKFDKIILDVQRKGPPPPR